MEGDILTSAMTGLNRYRFPEGGKSSHLFGSLRLISRRVSREFIGTEIDALLKGYSWRSVSGKPRQPVIRMKPFKGILIYLVSLPFSFGLFAVAWALVAPYRLYHCWDDAAPFLVSWFPPFIHPWADSADGALRDYYLVPEWVVFGTWYGFIAGALLLPMILILLDRPLPLAEGRESGLK